MKIEEAITIAVKNGFRDDYPRYCDEWEVFLDPLFWHCLFGQKYGRIKALEFINNIFNGGTTEQCFEQVAGVGQEQQKETSSEVFDLQESGKKISQ